MDTSFPHQFPPLDHGDGDAIDLAVAKRFRQVLARVPYHCSWRGTEIGDLSTPLFLVSLPLLWDDAGIKLFFKPVLIVMKYDEMMYSNVFVEEVVGLINS